MADRLGYFPASGTWFPRVDLALSLFAGVMWYQGLTWEALPLALSPWLVRIASGRFPFRRTPFDVPLLMFLISAGIGVWAAYDQSAAWSKFWLLVGAVVLFYALSGQPKGNLFPIVGLLGFASLIVGCYFLLTHHWQAFPTKFESLNQVLLQWMAIRPVTNMRPLPPNVAASLLAISAPLLVAWSVHARRARRQVAFGAAMIGAIFVGILLLVSTSRGAWAALAVAAGAIVLVKRSRPLAGRTRRGPGLVLSLLLVTLALLGIIIGQYGAELIPLLDRSPSLASAVNRLDLSRHTLDLMGDFPLTGGGLASFPALYSHYILVVPDLFLPNAHNIFLDVALEQGPLGVVTMAVVFLGSFVLLLLTPKDVVDEHRRPDSDGIVLRLALGASLIVMLIHGLVEDTVYSSPAILFLFTLPGLAVALSLPPEGMAANTMSRGTLLAAAATVLTLLVLILGWLVTRGQSPASVWQVNLGAIRMAQSELSEWPTGRWDDGSHVQALTPAETLFEQALISGENRTAHHRLGLIAMLRRDYETAIRHLEAAAQLDGSHRGIRKNLAYSYVWAGRFKDAQGLLVEIPEAQQEMEVYNWWWTTQGRQDLARRAADGAANLAGDHQK